MQVLINILTMLLAIVLMEIATALVHRYVMHGWGWRWHKAHHDGDGHRFNANDLYALIPAAVSFGLMWFDDGANGPLLFAGAGMAIYGLLYAFVHEGLAHGRWPLTWRPRNAYVKRLVQAHRLHHAVDGREGGVSFGFLYAPPVAALKARLRQRHGDALKRRDSPVRGPDQRAAH